jgi:hypothetical protein
MLNALELEKLNRLSEVIRDLEADATARGCAIFDPIETDHGEIFFAYLNGSARIILGDRPLTSHTAKNRLDVEKYFGEYQ